MVLFVLSMLLKSERKVKIGLAAGNLFAVYHLWALGSTVAALISLAAFVRLGLAAWVSPKSKSGLPLAIGFSVFYAAVSIVFYKSPLDLLAFVGTMVNTWAVFLLTGVRFRAALALGMTIWVAFDFSVGAVEMAVASLLSAVAAFYAWGREWRLEKTREAQCASQRTFEGFAEDSEQQRGSQFSQGKRFHE